MLKLVTGNVLAGEILEKLRELVIEAKTKDPQLEAGKVVDLAFRPKGQNLEVTLLFQACRILRLFLQDFPGKSRIIKTVYEKARDWIEKGI